jgi:enoyl-[acyl-carrier protein] reductase II
MKETRASILFGIDYPILQGGMLWLATAELASAVSNAGGLGIISPFAGMNENGDPIENLRLQIARTRELTQKPFGVNIPLDLPLAGLLLDALLQEGVKIVVTAAGSPRDFTEFIHAEGCKVLHVISSVRQAQLAEECRVEAVIAEGVEAAARLGFDELPLFSLIPQVAEAVSIPIIASGGIVDGRGVVAAYALGADGVQIGTRFVATEECIAHQNYKRAIVEARDGDTVVTGRRLVPTRSLKSPFSMKFVELEKSSATDDSLREFLGRGRARRAQIDGDMVNGDAYAGSSVGLIRDVVPAALIVQRLVEGYKETMARILENA